jgi:hypothetical protein
MHALRRRQHHGVPAELDLICTRGRARQILRDPVGGVPSAWQNRCDSLYWSQTRSRSWLSRAAAACMEGRPLRTPLSAYVSVGLVVLAVDSISAQAPVPVGVEFEPPVIASGSQGFSDVGVDTAGDFVVVWRSFDGSQFGVLGRRFNSAGVAQGGQFQVNTYTTGDQGRPVVDLDADGDFVVVWESEGQDGDLSGLFARRFSSAGASLGGEFRINTATVNLQRNPSVALDGDGDFVVAWEAVLYGIALDLGIFARRFSSTGVTQGSEFRVNTHTPSLQASPSVDRDADGDFVVTWSSGGGQDGHFYGIFGQRFNSAGARVATEFQVNTTFTGLQIYPEIGVDGDGDFVIVWFGPAGGAGVFGQRYASSGARQGVEFLVHSTLPVNDRYPAVAVDDGGGFVVTWTDEGRDGSGYGIFARRFAASGEPRGLEVLVNTTTEGDQVSSSVGARADGDFVVSWTGPGGAYTDVFAQRFATLQTIDVDGDGQYLPLTDGLLLLRFGFGFTGSTLITDAVGAGCTRCNAGSITAYLQSLL